MRGVSRPHRQPYARRLAAAPPAAFGRDLVQVGQHLELSRANAVERAFTEYENSAQHRDVVRFSNPGVLAVMWWT